MRSLRLLLFAFFTHAVAQSPLQYTSRVGRLEISVGQGNGLSKGKSGDGIAFLTTRSGEVFSIEESTGKVLSRNSPITEGICESVVDWNKGSQGFGAYNIGNTIVLVKVDGTAFDDFTVLQGDVVAQPIVYENLVFVASNTNNAGYISVYDPTIEQEAKRLFAQQTLVGVQIGPLSKGENGIYFGGNNGIVFMVSKASLSNPQVEIFWQLPSIDEDLRGKLHVDDSSAVLLTLEGGLYGWNTTDDSNLFSINLGAETNGVLIAPGKSKTTGNYLATIGSTVYAIDPSGQSVWESSGGKKSSAPLIIGERVMIMDRNGLITQKSVSTGKSLAGYPFTPSCNGESCGKVSGSSIVSDDKSSVLTIHDSGWLVAVCVDCITTDAPVTAAPITLKPITPAPVTLAPITLAPTTSAPTTSAPTTSAPTTLAPTTLSPVTPAPVTAAPVTPAPITSAPVTLAPSTKKPTTKAPTTKEPTTKEPTTLKPTTIAPTTKEPTTKAPTVKEPLTEEPTKKSTTKVPTVSTPAGSQPVQKSPTNSSSTESSFPSMSDTTSPSEVSNTPTEDPFAEFAITPQSSAVSVKSCLSILLTAIVTKAIAFWY